MGDIATMWVTVAVVVFAALSHTEAVLPKNDVCNGEQISANCPSGHVIVLSSALYGRMTEDSQCIQNNFGHIGCHGDVLGLVDGWCSGLGSCNHRVVKADLDDQSSSKCPADLTSYMEIQYECVQVVSRSRPCRHTQSPSTLSGSSGYLASSVTDSTGCGGPGYPWRVHARPGQRINLTVSNFAWAEHAGGSAASSQCDSIGVVSEQTLAVNRTLCAGSQRRNHAFTTMSNTVDITLLPSSQRQSDSNFIIEYSVVGCPDITPPPNTWYKRSGDNLTVGCRDNHKAWNLSCHNNQWTGVIGNCTEIVGYTEPTDEDEFLSPVLSIIIITSLAATIILLIIILVVGYRCLTRKKQTTPKRRPSEANRYVIQDEPSTEGLLVQELPGTLVVYHPQASVGGSREDLIQLGHTLPHPRPMESPYYARQPFYTYDPNRPLHPVNAPPPAGYMWSRPPPEASSSAYGGPSDNEYASLNLVRGLGEQETLRLRPLPENPEEANHVPALENANPVPPLSERNDSDIWIPRDKAVTTGTGTGPATPGLGHRRPIPSQDIDSDSSEEYEWEGTKKYHVLERNAGP